VRAEARVAIVDVAVAVVVDLAVEYLSSLRAGHKIAGCFVLYPKLFPAAGYLVHYLAGLCAQHLGKFPARSYYLIARVSQLMIVDIHHVLVVAAAVVVRAFLKDLVTAQIVEAQVVGAAEGLLLYIEVAFEQGVLLTECLVIPAQGIVIHRPHLRELAVDESAPSVRTVFDYA